VAAGLGALLVVPLRDPRAAQPQEVVRHQEAQLQAAAERQPQQRLPDQCPWGRPNWDPDWAGAFQEAAVMAGRWSGP
jgi:hypothetical protein